MRALFIASACCAIASGALGTGLCFFRANGVWHVDWPLLAAGFVGFLGSTNYSTGIKFKYRGLGVPFVAFLMGPLEIFVAAELLRPHATFHALSATLAAAACGFALFSLPVAALVCVIMHGNDMRDIPTDRLAGITTPSTLLGPRGALSLYWFCHLLPYLVCAKLCMIEKSATLLLPYFALPLTVRTLWKATAVYRSNPANPPWRGLERASGGIHFLFGVLYAAAIAWFRLCR